jgi:hypothetical protein
LNLNFIALNWGVGWLTMLIKRKMGGAHYMTSEVLDIAGRNLLNNRSTSALSAISSLPGWSSLGSGSSELCIVCGQMHLDISQIRNTYTHP